MSVIHATFKDGVFHPREPVALPDGSEVEFEPRIAQSNGNGADALAGVYGLLSKRYQSGESDVSARHNEHQP